MKTGILTPKTLLTATAAIVFLAGTAYAEVIKGRLVELSSVSKSITIAMEGGPHDKKIVNYKVDDNAMWHICLKEKCIKRKGIEGYRTVNEYAQFADYGIPHDTYGIKLDVAGDKATELEVQIIPNKHE